MPPPFTVRSGANPGQDAGTWDSTGSITIPGNLTVGGLTTLAQFALVSAALSGNLTVAGTLGVTGTSTLAAVNAGATAVSTLGSSGATSLATGGGATTVGGSLGVTGASTLAALTLNGALTVGTGAIGVPVYAYMPADVNVTASTTLVDATGLSWSVVPGQYIFDGWWSWFTPPSSAQQAKFAWSTPASTTGTWALFGSAATNNSRIGTIDTGSVVMGSVLNGSFDTTVGITVTARPAANFIVTTPGIIKLQWAQAVSDARQYALKQGSWGTLTRMA